MLFHFILSKIVENDKKIASSFLFGYCKECLPQRVGSTVDDVRESGAIGFFMSPAAQIMKIKAEKTCFFLFNQRSKQEIKCLEAF